MAAGLPGLVERDVGCAKDLLKEGVNSYILPNSAPECLATCQKNYLIAGQNRTDRLK